MRKWHWKWHWKVQPHWNTSENTPKSFTTDDHSEIFTFITLKFVCYCHDCYSKMLIHYNLTENFQRYPYPLFCLFSALLYFLVWFSESFSEWARGVDHQWSFNPKRVIFVVLYNDSIDYFIACFEHQCNIYNACILKSSLMYGSSWDRDRFRRTFVSTLFAASLKNHKNYREAILPVGSSVSLLW